jgi:hypothetical protein
MSTVEAPSGDWAETEGEEAGGYSGRHRETSKHRRGGSVAIIFVLRNSGVAYVHTFGDLT